jgi:hypothetical protein
MAAGSYSAPVIDLPRSSIWMGEEKIVVGSEPPAA